MTIKFMGVPFSIPFSIKFMGVLFSFYFRLHSRYDILDMMNWKKKVSFSQSGANALTLGWQSIRIWGRDDVGLWAVKAVISATRVWDAYFHPMAEHLIIFRRSHDMRIWEI